MNHLSLLAANFIALAIEASPWLLLGLFIAGLMKVWVPKQILSKHLGKGKFAIIKAAFIGAPLPLCSCGVIPVAVELRRSGASKEATSSFLVATPETGVDSVSVSYAMLGPLFAIYRPISAVLSAIATGLLVSTAPKNAEQLPTSSTQPSSCCSSKKSETSKPTSSCCSTTAKPTQATVATVTKVESSCCSSKQTADEDTQAATETKSSCYSSKQENSADNSLIGKTLAGLRYAATQLVDDLIVWLTIGLVFATLVKTYVPTEFLLAYGSGVPAMLVMIAISIPMYICATASTPIAAGFIMAGLSPGTALVFMMAGPATNISTLGMVKKEMGSAVLTRYLAGIATCAIAFGLLLDHLVAIFGISMQEHMQHSHELVPYWLGLASTIVLTLLAIKPLRSKFL